ncbi:hypothetical protein [Sphingomonas daechungensis]
MTFALVAALVTPNPVELVDTTRRLSIPQPIFWEMQPYLNCLIEQSNAQLKAMGGATEEKFPEIKRVAIAGCQTARASTKAAAVKALRNSDVRRAERSDYVERTLIAVENHVLDAPHRAEPVQ